MMNRRQAMTIGLGVAAAVKFPMTARAAVKKAGDGVLRLGQTTALTGPNSAVGKQFRDAALGWFEDLNAEGGVNGLKVELFTLDDGGVVERSTTNAKLLTASHGAVGFFGFVGPGANREGMQ